MNDTMAPGADNRSDEISALADGALRGDAFAAALDRLAGDPQARACWHAYHVVGDVLRCPDLAVSCTGDADFLGRLQGRLALEPQPAWAAATLPLPLAAAPMAVPALSAPAAQAANADSFRWKMVAGFASVAAVAAIGWNSLAVQQAGSPAVLALAAPGASALLQPPQTQQAPAVLQARAEPRGTVEVAAGPGEGPVMIRNAQLDELLAAHNQAIGGAALQSQARFVRNANFQDLPR
ncbi:MAG: sigma-E factor negative regulatory protein [Pseudomonadota bacterium]